MPYCYLDSVTPVKISRNLERIAAALGDRLCGESNPCDALAYYDLGEKRPWRISDDHCTESYGTVAEAIAAARNWNVQ